MRMLEDELHEATTIVLPESKAFPLVLLAKQARLKAAFIRKRDYNEQNLFEIHQQKVYTGATTMYCVKNALDRSDKLLIVDDMISSGGTQIAIIRALQEQGFSIVGIGSVYERGDGIERIRRETGYRAKGLARLEIVNGRARVERFYDETVVRNVTLV